MAIGDELEKMGVIDRWGRLIGMPDDDDPRDKLVSLLGACIAKAVDALHQDNDVASALAYLKTAEGALQAKPAKA